MNTPRKFLRTFDEVVSELGGGRVVGMLCDRQSHAAVLSWRLHRKRFPTKFYLRMISRLHAKGIDASPELWGFTKEDVDAFRQVIAA